MHRVLVTASLMAVFAIVVYAAVPFGGSPRTNEGAQEALPAGDASGTQGPSRGSTRVAPATLTGDVRDAQGGPISGAVVDAVHKGGTWRGLALTDREGRFAIAGVPRGDIEITVLGDHSGTGVLAPYP